MGSVPLKLFANRLTSPLSWQNDMRGKLGVLTWWLWLQGCSEGSTWSTEDTFMLVTVHLSGSRGEARTSPHYWLVKPRPRVQGGREFSSEPPQHTPQPLSISHPYNPTPLVTTHSLEFSR